MRFSFFPTDEREARLLGFAGEAPEQVQPEPDVNIETTDAETSVPERPEDVSDAVTGETEAVQSDIDGLDTGNTDTATVDAGVDTSAVEGDQDIVDAATAVDAATGESTTTEQVDPRGAPIPEFANTPGYDAEGYLISATPLETRTETAEPNPTESTTQAGTETSEQPASTENTPPQAESAEATGEGTTETTDQSASTEAAEKQETPEQRFDRAKTEQRLAREQEKVKQSGTEWGTIDAGKTDAEGNPFLYKNVTITGPDGQPQQAVLAYSPKGTLQAMDPKTGEWKYVNPQSMPKEQYDQLTQQAQGIDKEYQSNIDASKKKDPDAYNKRAEQNQRNHDVEENVLKAKDMTPDAFRKKEKDPMWTGNEKIQGALTFALRPPEKFPTPGEYTPEAETEETPGEKTEDTEETPGEKTEDTEETPGEKTEDTEETPGEKTEDTEETPGEKTEDTEETPGEKTEDTEETPGEKTEGPSEEDVTNAEKVIENPDTTSAERAEAIKTLTEAALAELGDAESANKAETTPGESASENDVKVIERAEAREESDEELRGRIMAEARNAEPDMKKGEDLKTEKQEAYNTWKEEYDGKLASAETAVTDQRTKLDGLKTQIAGLESAAGPDAEGLADLRATLATEEAKLQTLEQNVQTLKDNAALKESELRKDLGMIDTLTEEASKLSERTDKKLQEMGDKLADLGETDMATIARNIIVKHDGSFGMEMSGVDARLSDKIDAFIEDKDKVQLDKSDNPVPALKGIAGYLKNVEARKTK